MINQLEVGTKVFSETLDDKRTVFGVVVGMGKERKRGVDVIVECHRAHDGEKFSIATSQDWWKPYGEVNLEVNKLHEVYVGKNLSNLLKLHIDLENADEHLSFLVKNDPNFAWQEFSDMTKSMLRAINKLI
tara:strand:+ start:42 stop:434 length:393 start_codon:yes stop_codon:yes gene_type:complete